MKWLVSVCAVATLFSLMSLPVSAQTFEKALERALESRERALASRERNGVPLDLARSPLSIAPQNVSTGVRVIGWQDLRPAHVSSETPFASLDPVLLDAMRTNIEWRTSTPREREEAAFIERHQAALKLLSDNEVDVDGLMTERRKIIAQNGRAARGANPDIIGQSVRLPGYVIPLTFDEAKVTEFLFVPVAGSCVHTPTPPPNQIVRVDYPRGLAFSSIFEAFWIEGKLVAEDTRSDVVFSDGASNVEAQYSLNATAVEVYNSR